MTAHDYAESIGGGIRIDYNDLLNRPTIDEITIEGDQESLEYYSMIPLTLEQLEEICV